ncbi:MAG: hypothetical protein P8Y95_01950 [Gammaproteobacteria bacterium]
MSFSGRVAFEKAAEIANNPTSAVMMIKELLAKNPLDPDLEAVMERDVQMIEPAKERVHPPLGLGAEVHLGESLEQARERDLGLESREGRSDAQVYAVAERDLLDLLAGDVELVGTLVRCRVAVPARDADEDQVPPFQMLAVEVHVFQGEALRCLNGGLEAQHLFHGVRDELGRGAESVELLGGFQQQVHAVADQARGGLVAGDEEQQAGVVELLSVQLVAFLFRTNELPDEVVTRLFTAFLDDALEVVDQRPVRALRALERGDVVRSRARDQIFGP